MWDPGVYGRYGDERSRPFFELVARSPPNARARSSTSAAAPAT